MFNFNSIHNQDNQSDSFFPHDRGTWNVYDCLVKAWNAPTWLGRAVYLFSSIIGTMPGIVLICQLAQKILLPSNHPHHDVKRPDPSQDDDDWSPIDEKKEIGRKEEVVKDDGYDNGIEGDDDEALAKQLQDEFYAEGGHQDGDDEAYAKKLQEELDFEHLKATISPQSPPHVDNDEKLAKELQEEFFNGNIEQQQTQTSAISPVQEITIEDDSEKLQKTEDATYQILKTPGFIACLCPEDNDSSKMITIYEFQSDLLLAVAASLTKEFPQAISSAALRAQRSVNFEQYLAFKLKQFSHVEKVKGTVILPGGKLIKLEGFFEVFAAPMVISSYETYSKKSKFFKPSDRDWIISRFNQMMFSDYVSKKDVEHSVTTLQDPNFEGPLLMQTGFVGHCAAVAWFRDFMFYIDRGCINTEPGIYIFHIPDRALMTEDFFNELVKTEDVEKKDYRMLENILSQLNATLVHYERMSAQKVGNCTHATMDGVLNVLMAIRVLLNEKKGKLSSLDESAWSFAFAKVKPEHTAWSLDERKVIFDDMITEIEEWLTHKTDIGKLDLKKTYQDVLTYWLFSDAKRQPVAIDRVKKLLSALEQEGQKVP